MKLKLLSHQREYIPQRVNTKIIELRTVYVKQPDLSISMQAYTIS